MSESRRLHTLVFLIAAMAAAVAPFAFATEPKAWTVDDILLAETASGWTISPDGALAAWVRSTVEKVDGTEKRVSNLWLTRLADGTSYAMTRGQDTVSAPAFAPDGARIAFLSTRKVPGEKGDAELGKTQLWAIPLAGGEAFPLSRFDRDVLHFAWTGAGTLVAAAKDSPSAWERERKTRKDDATAVDDAAHEPPVRLFRVTLDGGAERLTANTDWIDALAVSPDGALAVITAQQSLSYEYDQRVPPQTFLVDLATGARTRLFAHDKLLPQEIRWAADGKGFYLVNQYSRDPRYRTATIDELYYFDLAARRAEKVELSWARGLGPAYAPASGGVVALLADGVRFRPVRLTRTATRVDAGRSRRRPCAGDSDFGPRPRRENPCLPPLHRHHPAAVVGRPPRRDPDHRGEGRWPISTPGGGPSPPAGSRSCTGRERAVTRSRGSSITRWTGARERARRSSS